MLKSYIDLNALPDSSLLEAVKGDISIQAAVLVKRLKSGNPMMLQDDLVGDVTIEEVRQVLREKINAL